MYMNLYEKLRLQANNVLCRVNVQAGEDQLGRKGEKKKAWLTK